MFLLPKRVDTLGGGACEGYSLEVGDGYARFHASVVRSIFDFETRAYNWTSSINGRDERKHSTREEAMGRTEHELSVAGELFVAEYQAFRANRR